MLARTIRAYPNPSCLAAICLGKDAMYDDTSGILTGMLHYPRAYSEGSLTFHEAMNGQDSHSFIMTMERDLTWKKRMYGMFRPNRNILTSNIW